MKRTAIVVIALTCAPALFAARVPSSGSGAQQGMSPQQMAADDFRRGAQLLDRAAKQHAEWKAAANEKEREAVQKKLTKTLETAARSFEKALSNDPRMVQAYSELGFALRKLGRYEQSLAAYDKALAIVPDYAPAIEYRAEAYLGLNRVAEAKSAYLALFASDRARADLLFAAMQKWVAERNANAAGADPQEVAALAKFVDERAAIHAQTSPASMASKDLRTW